MTKQRLIGRGTPEGWRRLVRVRRRAGECEHRAFVGAGDRAGRCLECGSCVRTPFTIHRSEGLPVSGRRDANLLRMDEVRLPAVVVPVLEACAA